MDLEQKTVKFALSYSLELPNEFSKYYFLVSSPMKISLTLTEKASKKIGICLKIKKYIKII